jgi:transcriptional regulator with AAA-type ATPase domain/transcriptional regulatory protein LevR
VIDVKKKLLALINDENPKNPYNDTELASLLHTTRYEVIRLRKKYGILDYRKRRLPVLYETIKHLMKAQQNLTTADLTNQLVENGFNVSRFLISELRDKIEEEIVAPIVEAPRYQIEKSDEMIGQHGSIEQQIKKMKAAMLYPPNGLHTIVVGETGTGKSMLVDLTFKQLKREGLIPDDKKIIKYNCADYANNPQLLASQLFGYVKGAFTGADGEKEGLIKEADGGIIFLDEIHRLSSEGQEMLFTVIDEGKYRKLGQSSKPGDINVMIIGATTENVNSSLLETFKRRIPMLIELPSLKHRTIDERFMLVARCLQREANAIAKNIYVNSECLVNLLTYPCRGNIGQLTSDIRVAVANGFLRTIEDLSDEIKLEIVDFGKNVQEGFTKDLLLEDVDFYREHGIVIKPRADQVEYVDEKNIYVMPNDIFTTFRDRYENFMSQGLPMALVDNLIYRELDYRLVKMMKTVKSKNGPFSKAYGHEITAGSPYSAQMLDMLERKVGNIDLDIRRCLVWTLEDAVQKVKQGWPFVNFKMTRVEKTHLMEYSIAQEVLEVLENSFEIVFPMELTGIIALYLKNNADRTEKERLVRIIVITHGDIGREIAKVVNTFLNEQILDWIGIPLNLKKEAYIEYVLEKISGIDETNLLLLVDIGSLLVLGEIIASRTDKQTKTISRVDLAIALEAAVKLKQENITLTEIYDYIKRKTRIDDRKDIGKAKQGDNIIVVSCITGQGAAIGIKTYIEDNYPNIIARGIKVMPIGVLGQDLEAYLNEIRKSNRIIACIGAVTVQIEDVPFIKIEDIMQSDGSELLNKIIDSTVPKLLPENSIQSNCYFEDAIFEKVPCRNKEEAIATIADRLCALSYVTDEFRQNVLAREKAISTHYKNGTAIPHTYSKYVKKSVIAIAKLEAPIYWAENYLCDMMFMVALKDEDTKALKGLSKLINNEAILQRIKEGDASEIISIITNRR